MQVRVFQKGTLRQANKWRCSGVAPLEELLSWSAPPSPSCKAAGFDNCWNCEAEGLQGYRTWARRMGRGQTTCYLNKVQPLFIDAPQSVASFWLISRDGKSLILTFFFFTNIFSAFMEVWIYRSLHSHIPGFLPN